MGETGVEHMDNNAAGSESAFGFSGTWQEYAPIAFTNLLLNIVTLSIYSSWAKTRTRRYLWSRTRFIDDRLDYTGTGLELFIGKIMAFFLFVLPFGAINLIFQGVLMRGHQGAAGLIGLVLYLLLLYLVGVAIFRALRYRLSRTFWHGIRGGSDDQGFAFGFQYFWRSLVGYLTLGLMVPWSMTTLWNRRWGAMSFGPMRFRAEARWRPIFGRFLIFYALPIILTVGAVLLMAVIGGLGFLSGGFGPGRTPGPGLIVLLALAGLAFYAFFFGVLGIVALIYYSAFFREAVGTLRLGGLEFGFTARTKAFIRLYLGNVGLVIVTLGIGYIFAPYRNWVFFVRHAQAYGDVVLDDLTQSATREPGQGEGLLDAFDVGAF